MPAITIVSLLLTVIAVTVASAGALSPQTSRAAAALDMTLVIVSTNQPSLPTRPGGAPGQPGEQQAAPGGNRLQGGQGQPQAVGTASAQGGPCTPAAHGTAAAQAGSAGGNGQAPQGECQRGQGEGNRGGNQQGGRPGGPGGFTCAVDSYKVAGGLAIVFALLALVGTALSVPLLRGTVSDGAPISYGKSVGPVLAAVVMVSVVPLLVIQLVPVSRENPPVQSPIKWDSPQTQQLWQRACADCHSNETFGPGTGVLRQDHGCWLFT